MADVEGERRPDEFTSIDTQGVHAQARAGDAVAQRIFSVEFARRGFMLAGLGLLAACAATPTREARVSDPDEVPDGLWTTGDLPPQRFARPVSPVPREAPAAPRPAVDRPSIAAQAGRTVGPEAKPQELSGAGIPRTYEGTVLRRALWTSWFPADRDMDPLGKVKRITVHHEGNGAFNATSIAECKARLVNVLNGERGVGHRDIAYHYVIDPAGRVWEARDIRWEGRHTRNNHANNLGVMCLGNFELQSIPPAQLSSLERFLRDLQAKHRIGRRQVFTHQELSPTLCPGKDLQRKMGPLRTRLA